MKMIYVNGATALLKYKSRLGNFPSLDFMPFAVKAVYRPGYENADEKYYNRDIDYEKILNDSTHKHLLD